MFCPAAQELRLQKKLLPTTGLCAGVALEFLPPETAAWLLDKDKYLEPMFGDVGQARTNARICRTVDCYNLKPHLHKTHCWQ